MSDLIGPPTTLSEMNPKVLAAIGSLEEALQEEHSRVVFIIVRTPVGTGFLLKDTNPDDLAYAQMAMQALVDAGLMFKANIQRHQA